MDQQPPEDRDTRTCSSQAWKEMLRRLEVDAVAYLGGNSDTVFSQVGKLLATRAGEKAVVPWQPSSPIHQGSEPTQDRRPSQVDSPRSDNKEPDHCPSDSFTARATHLVTDQVQLTISPPWTEPLCRTRTDLTTHIRRPTYFQNAGKQNAFDKSVYIFNNTKGYRQIVAEWVDHEDTNQGTVLHQPHVRCQAWLVDTISL